MITFDTTVTVVRFRQNGVDKLGKPKMVAYHRRSGVRARLTLQKSIENPTFITDRYIGILDPAVKISASDEVVDSRGRRFHVRGSPELKKVPGFSPLDHVEASLQLVEEKT